VQQSRNALDNQLELAMIQENIRLASVVAAGAQTLPGFIDHYYSLGVAVNNFSIVLHSESKDCLLIEKSLFELKVKGINDISLAIGPWHENLNRQLLADLTSLHPDNWWIVADVDELQVYPYDLQSVCKIADTHSADYVEGCFLDRVGVHGALSPILPEKSLWELFPIAAFLSWYLAKANPQKIVLKRGWVSVGSGQHAAISGRPLHHRLCYTQVHHFKWTNSVVPYLEKRVASFENNRWQEHHPSLRLEAASTLAHISQHNGRLNINDSRVWARICSSSYGDYNEWERVIRLVKKDNSYSDFKK
jgi:hypothetical protein